MKSTNKPVILNDVETLIAMLSHPRPANSDFELEFINKWILPVAAKQSRSFMDESGNIVISIGKNPRTMFCAHTDTVRGKCPDKPNNLKFKDGLVSNSNGGILGADDTTGCFILLNLIQNQIPGLYVFFRKEECGGIGSSDFAVNYRHLLDTIKVAISFDRKGYKSVITHQSTGRCCSDAFAVELAAQLNHGIDNDTFSYVPDDTGVFTDTANFVDIVPECTNISVGYFNEHTPNEKQDLVYAVRLVDRLLAVNWEVLPVIRNPQEAELFSCESKDYYDFFYDSNSKEDDDYMFIEPTDEELNMVGLNREEYRDSGLEVEDIIYCLDQGIDVRTFIFDNFSTAASRAKSNWL